MCVLSHGLLCINNNTIPLTSIGSTKHGANVINNKQLINLYYISKRMLNILNKWYNSY